MIKYILFFTFVALVFVLFFSSYCKRDSLIGTIRGDTYILSHDPTLVWDNIKLDDIANFNNILSEKFPKHQIYITFSKEHNPIMIILHDEETEFSNKDDVDLFELFCKWTNQLSEKYNDTFHSESS